VSLARKFILTNQVRWAVRGLVSRHDGCDLDRVAAPREAEQFLTMERISPLVADKQAQTVILPATTRGSLRHYILLL
jgi:hypothetical protein